MIKKQGGTTSNMCRNCTVYAREMINKWYNKVVKAMSDEQGNLSIGRDDWSELSKWEVNNFWQTDFKLHQHLEENPKREN